MGKLATLFKLDSKGLDVPRALLILCIALIEFVVLYRTNMPQYFLSVLFGTLFVGLSDPGGNFSSRTREMLRVGVLGSAITTLGFAVGSADWVVVTLTVFIVTLLCGLAIKFGVHSFVAVLMLNIWFIITIALAAGYHEVGTTINFWLQALYWLAGGIAWIAAASVIWLVRGGGMRPAPIRELPDDTTHKILTKQLVLFAVIRALAVAIATGIAFGLKLPHADWMPVAAIVAMKANLKQSSLVASQRLVGTLIGAIVASIALVSLKDKPAIAMVAIVLLTVGVAIRFVNYTLYCSCIAAAVLIIIDLPHPSDLKAEGERVLFTFIGVGIGWIVMLLAEQLGKHSPSSPTHEPIMSRGANSTA